MTTTQPATTTRGDTYVRYDAFISYSHAADGRLAPRLQQGLHALGKPWNRRRALRVFRDKTSLTATPELWESIVRALESARFFVLLASPEAAASRWVGQEVEWWLAHRSPERLLIVLTAGELYWDDDADDFDWTKTTALPHMLRGAFRQEPLWVDLRWAHTEEQVSRRDPRFQDAVADLAAPIHDVPKDDLLGEDVRQHRRALLLARSAVVVLVLLLVGVGTAGIVAVRQRDRANEQARIALSRQLAAESRDARNDQLDLGLLLSAQSYDFEPTTQARGALLGVLARNPHLKGYIPGIARATALALDPNANRLAIGTPNGAVSLWNLADLSRLTVMDIPGGGEVTSVAFSPDSRIVAAGSARGSFGVWDAGNSKRIAESSLGSRVQAIAFDRSATLVAAGDDGGVVHVWQTGANKPRYVLRDQNTNTLIFRGQSLVSADGQGRMTVWDFTDHPRQVNSDWVGGGQPLVSAFSDDARLFAGVTLGQQTPYVFDVVAGDSLYQDKDNLTGPASILDDMAFSPDGGTLATLGEGKVTLWDVTRGTARPNALSGAPTAAGTTSIVVVGGGGSRIAAAGQRGVAVWELASHTLRRSLPITGTMPSNEVPNVVRGATSAAFSNDGRLLAWTVLGQASLEVVVWHLDENRELMRFPSEKVIGFSPDGTILATSSFNQGGFTLVNIHTGDRRKADAVPWAPKSERTDGRPWATTQSIGLGASIAFDGTLTLWDVDRRQPLGTVAVPDASDASALVFNPGGKQLAVASSGGALTLVDTDVQSWHRKACSLAGRALSRAEWNAFIGPKVGFNPSC